MSLSSATGKDNSWEGMEHQGVNFKYTVLTGLSGSNGFRSQRFDNYMELDPADGLHRGEVAELVALEVEHLECAIEPTDGDFATQPGYGRFELQLSREGFTFDTINDGQPDFTTVNIQVSDDFRHVFYFGKARATQPYFDSVDQSVNDNGTGDSPILNDFRNYRDEFGMGPLFFDDDVLNDHAYLQAVNVPNDIVVGTAEFHLYWDVYEASQLDSRFLPARLQ